jgi:hypothetical protein
MQGLSLMEHLHKYDIITNDRNEDLNFDFEMNEFGNETKDDHEMILQNLELHMEDLMD